jgi:hypothetical protein
MDLIIELQKTNPNKELLLNLLTDENVSYADDENFTPLMCAFEEYGVNPNVDSEIFYKFLDMNCNPNKITRYGHSALLFALGTYGTNPNCDPNILHKLLDMDCIPEQIDENGETALIMAFRYYSTNPNCDNSIFHRLLDMDCVPGQVNIFGDNALNQAFRRYSKNKNYDPSVFLKLIRLYFPSLTRIDLIQVLDTRTKDHNLRKKILGVYNYEVRSTYINNRITKRILMNKQDSMYIL